ncbi:MAG: hypothetical protein HY843_03510 [Bdellovibrio sp.]|nr:hypothetical protein [Bdellovibrio sp.]
MISNKFEITLPAKWILSGEHAVLRGAPALALPLFQFSLTLTYTKSQAPFSIKPKKFEFPIIELLNAKTKDFLNQIKGKLEITSTIPIGAGLGSSAALCVALTKWLRINANSEFEFARNLENFFHGKSSGLDIAVLLNQKPVFYQINKGPTPLQISSLPHFTFHDTGVREQTKTCIAQVTAKLAQDQKQAKKIDQAMKEASQLCLQGLNTYNLNKKAKALLLLTEGMKKAQRCFESWGLLPSQAKGLEKELYQKGALAVKLTGAGLGGFLAALWE